MTVRILMGDCRERLRELPDESVHCVVTSPPYWGLRDYGVNGQIGLEPTFEEWLARMIDVFAGVHRVLRSDGTAWVNMGDAYNSGTSAKRKPNKNANRGPHADVGYWLNAGSMGDERVNFPGLKPKDLIGQPWRLAFALQAAGWYLRQDIIWAKPNPMPESIRDRCTKSHEYLFLLSKSARYYYDFGAMQEPASEDTHERRAIVPAGWATGDAPNTSVAHQNEKQHRKARKDQTRHAGRAIQSGFASKVSHRKVAPAGSGTKNNGSFDDAMSVMPSTRNKRSVWTVGTRPFKDAHFATFPPELIEPCILAGCPRGGVVLDPFGGAGTTGLVAERHHRDSILIELNPAYAEMARNRIKSEAPLLAEIAA